MTVEILLHINIIVMLLMLYFVACSGLDVFVVTMYATLEICWKNLLYYVEYLCDFVRVLAYLPAAARWLSQLVTGFACLIDHAFHCIGLINVVAISGLN